MYKILVSQPASASNQSSASTFSLIMATTYQIKSTQVQWSKSILEPIFPSMDASTLLDYCSMI